MVAACCSGYDDHFIVVFLGSLLLFYNNVCGANETWGYIHVSVFGLYSLYLYVSVCILKMALTQSNMTSGK